MTNKEYKEKCARIAGFDSRFDALTLDEVKELNATHKAAKRGGKAYTLEGFTNRAIMHHTAHGFELVSYFTTVAAIVDGEVVKAWDGYSATTMKHINAFREFFGLPRLSKREWVELPAVGLIIDDSTGEILFPLAD